MKSIDYVMQKFREDGGFYNMSSAATFMEMDWSADYKFSKRVVYFGEGNAVDVYMQKDDDAEFEYYISDCVTCTEDEVPTEGLIASLYLKILQCMTYDKQQTVPANCSSVCYIAGNPVVIIENDERFAPIWKPTQSYRFCVVVPIRYVCEPKAQ